MEPARWPLLPLSMIYGGIIRVRNWYYDRGSRAVRRAAAPVISVGNLTVGGTGKTPMVIEIVSRLQGWGRRPAILTRGYKARVGETADEVREFEQALPGVPVVVNPDRMAGAAEAGGRHGADCLVLDDAFQHRRLGRDLDVVLIDALDPWGGGHVLPAGRLREPRSALGRADALVITRANQATADVLQALTAELQALGNAPVLQANVEATRLVGANGAASAPDGLRGRKVLAVCGLGNPRTFRHLVEGLAHTPCEMRRFEDHHHYTPADATRLQAAARRSRAELVVTTRKDWVKLAPLWTVAEPELWRVDVRLVIVEPGELDLLLQRALQRTA